MKRSKKVRCVVVAGVVLVVLFLPRLLRGLDGRKIEEVGTYQARVVRMSECPPQITEASLADTRSWSLTVEYLDGSDDKPTEIGCDGPTWVKSPLGSTVKVVKTRTWLFGQVEYRVVIP